MKSKINEDGPQITKKLKTIEQNFFNKLNTVESSTEIFDQTLESLHRIKKDYPEHSKLANTVRNNIMIDYINHASEEQMIQLAVNCKSTFAQFEKVMKSKQIKEQKKKLFLNSYKIFKLAFNDPEETKEETKITTELSSILKQERQNRKELHEKIENAKIENDFDIINSEATNNLKDFNISSKSTESDKNKGVKSYLNTMYNAAAKIVKPITHRFQKSSKNSKKSKQNSI